MKPFTLILLTASLALCQNPAPDAKGCQDSKVLTRLPGCRIMRCRTAQYDLFEMPVAKPAGKPIEKKALEGEFEQIAYECGAGTSPLEIARNAENAFRQAGFNIPYSDRYFTTRFYVTAQKGSQWAYVAADGRQYLLTTVKTKEMEQAMKAGAEGWIEQINQTGRASIYGINFDTAKATIRPDSEKVLSELVSLLQKQPEWSMVIAGHTDNVGSDAVNVPLSRQRAEAVIAWLAAKGIDKSRLVPAGFGSKKPVADNGTDDGKAKNRRVDLVKLY
ncbi:MAG TPA: OmpA family protein [Bryobacteraceae bacterium]|nr:OmpA family protein [Bryobacteraceae bacterium]